MPPEPGTFNELVRRSAADPGMAHLVDVIQKELLHYDVLTCMARSGFLGNLVFQGGTALRLNKDVWDLYWLSGKGVTPAPHLISAKASDYELKDYADMIEQTLADLPAILSSEGFRATMEAFLDVQAFNETFGSPQFSNHLARVMHELLGQAKALAFDG